MSKDDRVEVKRAVKQILFTLVNSTRKHFEDGIIKGIPPSRYNYIPHIVFEKHKFE